MKSGHQSVERYGGVWMVASDSTGRTSPGDLDAWYWSAVAPDTIAIIGASSNAGKNHYQRQLTAYGYAGGLFPINPGVDAIDGLPTYAHISEVPGRVDLALIALPARAIPAAVADCVAAGVPLVYVFASGFSEAGPDGVALEGEVLDILASSGSTRMLGPNGTGVLSVDSSMVATPLAAYAERLDELHDDGLALVSQSGLVGSAAFIASQLSRPAIGKVIAIGNGADLSLSDVVRAYTADESVHVIVVYMEGLRDPGLFLEAAREARRRGKPIIILKGGTTEMGAAAAASHTASLAGEGAVFDGVLAEHGVRRATSVTHMLHIARILRAYPRFASRRVMILTGSGGSGIVLTDLLQGCGLTLGSWSSSEKESLVAALPGYPTIANPLDGAAEFAWARPGLVESIRQADANEDSDVVVLALGGMPDSEPQMVNTLLEIKASEVLSKPLLVVYLGGTGRALRDLNSAGIPAFRDLDDLTRAMAAALDIASDEPWEAAAERPSAALDLLLDEVSLAQARGDRALDEARSKMVLGLAGIAVTRDVAASDVTTAVSAADEIGYPVVVKLRAPGLLHKSELGAVVTDVRTADRVATEATRLLAIAESQGLAGSDVIVYRYVPEGVELLLGMHRDPVFGSVVTFGLGGVLAEALDDVKTFTPAITYSGFVHAFGGLEHQKLLSGYRHLPAVDIDELWPVVEAFCRLVANLPAEVQEIDVNPLIVTDGGIVAVDAVFVLDEQCA